MVKDPSIMQLLSALKLTERGWKVVAHWEADLCAIGIRASSRRLVYVSTYKKQADRYDYECEEPTGPEETDYVTIDRGAGVTFEHLCVVVESHHGVEICDGLDNNCDGTVDEMAACPIGMVCTAGACTCSKTTCGDPAECIDTSIDTSNCGGCGHSCKAAEECVSGACKCQLPGG